MSTFLKKALANTSWLMSEKVISMSANLAVSVVLARTLGPEGFGMLSYLLAITSLIAPLATLGLNAIVTRELVNKPEEQNEIIATCVSMRFIGALLGSFIFIGIALSGLGMSNIESRWGLVALALGNLFTCFSVLEFWFQAHLAAKLVARMRLIVILIFSGIKISAVLLHVNFIVLVSIFAVEICFIGVGFIYIFVKQKNVLNLRLKNIEYGLSLIKQSFWLILSGFAAIVYLKVDQIMLENMVSTSAVGTYAVAAKLSEVWYFFPNAIAITLFSAILTHRKGNNVRLYNSKLQSISDLLFGLGLSLAFFVSIVAQPVIILLFGSDYEESAIILKWHIWAAVFVFMRALVSKWLIAEHLLKYSLLSHGLGAIVNIAANFYLIPLYGGLGAAIATVFSYFIASYLAFWVSSDTRLIAKIMTKSLLLPFTFGYRYWPTRYRVI